jgi:viroplasmin and RNaseH domain-containing protein
MMMARETKAERLAREEAESALRLETLKAEYPNKLMTTLTRAHKHDYDVVPFTTGFTVQKAFYRNDYETFRVTYHFSAASDDVLDSLNWVLDRLEEEQREELRRQEARSYALSKLTDEEKNLLGLE